MTARNLVHVLIAVAAFFCGGTIVSASIRVEPMAYELTPSGDRARQDLRVENTSDQPTPVELRVERRNILPDGSEKRSPADDDFLIFPPQGIVPANGYQTFRVQYIGPLVDHTILYVVTVAQQPVDTTGSGKSGVQFLFNLGTLAAVSPEASKPHLVVESVTPATAPNQLRITIRNDGSRYTRLRTGKWTFTAVNGTKETLEGEELQKAIAQSLIEPGTRRIIDLPVSANFVREGATATYELPASSK